MVSIEKEISQKEIIFIKSKYQFSILPLVN